MVWILTRPKSSSTGSTAPKLKPVPATMRHAAAWPGRPMPWPNCGTWRSRQHWTPRTSSAFDNPETSRSGAQRTLIDPAIALRLVCWFPPDSSTVVVALFAADKAQMGDVFYNSVGARADVAIRQWIFQTQEENLP